ncbi:lytic murein transglycosylase [Mesorhizobium sp. CAU 1732]|uniref:lytic murein transglycosylase n=1 Tax=Mesorhizobium sp. CAU 1732 TaxID=3140358 RepID=UPI003260A9AB
MLAALCLSLATLVSFPAAAQNVTAQFQSWLQNDLWPEAQAKGISAQTFNAAFGGVTPNLKLPDLVMPGQQAETPRTQHQAEFGSPGSYFAENTVGGVTAGGRSRANRLSQQLGVIEGRFGVPRGILLAIWGRESGFGRANIPHNAFEVLGTKAFIATRKDMFRKEVLAALEMVQRGHVSVAAMKSSWAGALGQPQFLPTSYLQHAVDGDGDGRADIWGSEVDTLASIANYLAHYGWVKGRDWGFEVTVPAGVSCALEGPDRGRRIADWASMGIQRVGGRPFPDHEARAEGYLLMPAGRSGPAFIVTPNFYVLKKYNESDLYALFVGHAADRISYGDRAFAGSWGRVGGLYRFDIAAMQRGLQGQGYDTGGADGLPGFRTRRSIGEWQAKNGRQPTCFPDQAIVGALK